MNGNNVMGLGAGLGIHRRGSSGIPGLAITAPTVYYPEANANDIGPNALHLTETGTPSHVAGVLSRTCVQLGTNIYQTRANAAPIQIDGQTGQCSIRFLFNFSALSVLPTNCTVWYKASGGTPSLQTLIGNNEVFNRCAMYWHNGTAPVVTEFGAPLNSDTWFQYVMTFNLPGGQMRGSVQSSGGGAPSWTTSAISSIAAGELAGDMGIGDSSAFNTIKIQEVAFWNNYILTDEEVGQLNKGGGGGTTFAYYDGTKWL